MTALRHTISAFFCLFALGIQNAHATKDIQPQAGQISMDLSPVLSSPLSTSASARLTNLLHQFSVQERGIARKSNTTLNNRYGMELQLAHHDLNIHTKPKLTENKQRTWLIVKHDHELVSNIPAVTTDTLMNQSRQLLVILDAKKATISQEIKNASFDAKDALISIIMPGGLLYASYRKHVHTQAKEQLIQVTNERNELAKDLLAIQSIVRPIALASAIIK